MYLYIYIHIGKFSGENDDHPLEFWGTLFSDPNDNWGPPSGALFSVVDPVVDNCCTTPLKSGTCVRHVAIARPCFMDPERLSGLMNG